MVYSTTVAMKFLLVVQLVSLVSGGTLEKRLKEFQDLNAIPDKPDLKEVDNWNRRLKAVVLRIIGQPEDDPLGDVNVEQTTGGRPDDELAWAKGINPENIENEDLRKIIRLLRNPKKQRHSLTGMTKMFLKMAEAMNEIHKSCPKPSNNKDDVRDGDSWGEAITSLQLQVQHWREEHQKKLVACEQKVEELSKALDDKKRKDVVRSAKAEADAVSKTSSIESGKDVASSDADAKEPNYKCIGPSWGKRGGCGWPTKEDEKEKPKEKPKECNGLLYCPKCYRGEGLIKESRVMSDVEIVGRRRLSQNNTVLQRMVDAMNI